ncbi:MAG: hypothetical protein BGO49_05630 [Planctomycetales bacterium 71-10]|nr:MAG: hypothetical protein BGO49_05630 [Planctomycetales bacterium 71-10]
MPNDRRQYLLWNFARTALVVGLATSVAASAALRGAPNGVSAAELDSLAAGHFTGQPDRFAANPNTEADNKCHYCSAVKAPAIGHIKCVDVAQVLIGGAYTYTQKADETCSPEVRIPTGGCAKGKHVPTEVACTTKKPIYVDP